MTAFTFGNTSGSSSDWDIFKFDEVPLEVTETPFAESWKASYDESVKGRLRESVWEYLDDDMMIDKFVTDLRDVLTENYKESNDKATKIKSMMTKFFGNHIVF